MRTRIKWVTEMLSDFRDSIDEILVVHLNRFEVELEMSCYPAGGLKLTNRTHHVGVKNSQVRVVAGGHCHHDRRIETAAAERTHWRICHQLSLNAGIQSL